MVHARHAVLTTLRLVMCTVEAQVRGERPESSLSRQDVRSQLGPPLPHHLRQRAQESDQLG